MLSGAHSENGAVEILDEKEGKFSAGSHPGKVGEGKLRGEYQPCGGVDGLRYANGIPRTLKGIFVLDVIQNLGGQIKQKPGRSYRCCLVFITTRSLTA